MLPECAFAEDIASQFRDLTNWLYSRILPLGAFVVLGVGAVSYIFGGDSQKNQVMHGIVGGIIAAASIMIISMLTKLLAS